MLKEKSELLNIECRRAAQNLDQFQLQSENRIEKILCRKSIAAVSNEHVVKMKINQNEAKALTRCEPAALRV